MHIQQKVGTLTVDGWAYIWYSEEWARPQLAQAPPRCTKLTAHTSTASVLITVLLYICNGPSLCGFNLPVTGSTNCISEPRMRELTKWQWVGGKVTDGMPGGVCVGIIECLFLTSFAGAVQKTRRDHHVENVMWICPCDYRYTTSLVASAAGAPVCGETVRVGRFAISSQIHHLNIFIHHEW